MPQENQIRKRYCYNCKYNLATVKVVYLDMVAHVCNKCYEKRPEGWEIEKEPIWLKKN